VGGESLIKKAPLLTRAEVASRKLLIVNGKAYAAEGYLSSHPGGAVLSTYLGADATDIFRAFHSGSKRSLAELDGFAHDLMALLTTVLLSLILIL
jgi:cytochrome b involved in lipid metabolism